MVKLVLSKRNRRFNLLDNCSNLFNRTTGYNYNIWFELYISITTISNEDNNIKYILLVDDHRDILFTFEIYLKSIRYPTVPFNDPVEALNYFNKNFINCMLVLTDYGMPHMSGLDLIEKIREKDLNYKIKIILISATVKNEIINYDDRFFKLKVDKFLEKPIPLDKLKNEIEILIVW